MAAISLATVNPNFGYVLATAASTVLLHHGWMAMRVVRARKLYNVKYPAMYADPAKNEKADMFNCIQRAHQNSLENLPAFLSLLTLSGLRHPLAASACGLLYLVGRVVYFNGYSTGKPEGRYRGGFLHFGTLGLLGITFAWAFELLVPVWRAALGF